MRTESKKQLRLFRGRSNIPGNLMLGFIAKMIQRKQQLFENGDGVRIHESIHERWLPYLRLNVSNTGKNGRAIEQQK